MSRWNRFDAFTKVEKNVQNLTTSGGLLTIAVTILLIYLSLVEWISYLTPNQNYEFLVDTFRSTHHSLQLNVDMTVAMNCDYVRADVVDGSGESMELEGVFTKERVNEFKLLDAHKLHEMTDTRVIDKVQVKKTIKEASKHHNDHHHDPDTPSKDHQSCRIRGKTHVNKVAGMLHLTAAGHGYWGEHTPHEAINFTHRIDTLTFGEYYPGLINPLDHSYEWADDNFDSFKYYVSIVPTIYVDRNKGANPLVYLSYISSIFPSAETVLLTNQYAVTEYRQTEVKTPGIFIKYDLEPVSVRITEEKATRFLHFLVRLCGIVGGIFVTVGMIHSFILWILSLFLGSRPKQQNVNYTPLTSPVIEVPPSQRTSLYSPPMSPVGVQNASPLYDQEVESPTTQYHWQSPLSSPVRETAPFPLPTPGPIPFDARKKD